MLTVGTRIKVTTNAGKVYSGTLLYIDDECLDMTDGEVNLFCPLISNLKSIEKQPIIKRELLVIRWVDWCTGVEYCRRCIKGHPTTEFLICWIDFYGHKLL